MSSIAAVLNGTAPFHAAIDEVKYTGSGNDVGEAMSYIATAATAQRAWYRLNPSGTGPSLSLPLVQKGSQATGKGDTSGIDLFNDAGGVEHGHDLYDERQR